MLHFLGLLFSNAVGLDRTDLSAATKPFIRSMQSSCGVADSLSGGEHAVVIEAIYKKGWSPPEIKNQHSEMPHSIRSDFISLIRWVL
jgi:hypothetical protein